MRRLVLVLLVALVSSCNNAGPQYDFDDSMIKVTPKSVNVVEVNPVFPKTGSNYYYFITNPKNELKSKQELTSGTYLLVWNKVESPFTISYLNYDKVYRIYMASGDPSSEDVEIYHRKFYFHIE